MLASSLASAAATATCVLLLLRAALSLNSLLHLISRFWRFLDDATQSHQIYKIPQYHLSVDGSGGCHQQQPNALYKKALAYVASLPTIEDSEGAHILSSGRKPNDFSIQPDPARSLVRDNFRGARISWSLHPGCLHLRLRRQDRHRVLRPYLQHVESVADELDLRRKELRLFTNNSSGSSTSLWNSVPFTHPSTLDTVAMDPDLKTRVKSDLELFLKGRAYYARLGRVWKRSYLLHGPPGTGKSTFVAAMAKFLSYDIYELDLSRHHHPDLKSLLLQTTPRSLILIEDLDRYLSAGNNKEQLAMTSMLSFMDGVFSCCGEERVMVFTMSSTATAAKDAVDPALLRPGRLDVHIYFPLCDFAGFKTLASSYLGLKEHKLYPQVEEGFQSGAKLSPAEVGEIMIANRGSPSRAIKTVISALQQQSSSALSESGSVKSGTNQMVEELMDGCGVRGGFGFGKDTTVREFKKLYGLIRRSGSRREGTLSVEMAAAAAAAAAASAGGHPNNGLEKAGL